MEPTPRTLPENAFRELKPGETYIPAVRDDERVPEGTLRSVVIGLLMTIIFSAAVGYITLKTGNGIEATIPIAIVAVGISAAFKRKNTLLENMNILAIGGTSSGVIGGTVFVLPALWVLAIDSRIDLFDITAIALLGALLGMLFLIPFRRYFVADMHGKFPFPEGTAITEILMASEKGGKQALLLAKALGFGFVFDGLVLFFKGWREVFSTAAFKFMEPVTNAAKLEFNMISSAAMAGLGYIIGLRYALIIMAGAFLAWWVLIPVFGGVVPLPFLPLREVFGLPPFEELRLLSPEEIFSAHVRTIGIGGIFAAGLISIFKLRRVIWQAMTKGLQGIFGSLGHAAGPERRTDTDIAMPKVLAMLVVLLVATFFFFRLSVLAGEAGATGKAVAATLVVAFVSFLLTAVSAWAIAMISITPVSGMTLTTLILTSVLMLRMGLGGESGMVATIMVGTVVCTALAMAGTLVTEFKISYWIGATPKTVEKWNLASAFVAALVGGLVMILMAKTYGFAAGDPRALPAPQANAMAAVIKSFFTEGDVRWSLYALGALISLIVELFGISALAFALGMYLPMEINSPLVFGSLVAWLLERRARDAAEAKRRTDAGTVIASGFIAGGSLAGIAGAFLILFKWDKVIPTFAKLYDVEGAAGNWMSALIFTALCVGLYRYVAKKRPEA